ncbi:hypothetical protein JCM6882_004527 [Rhodosporidiobolus microsporus]
MLVSSLFGLLTLSALASATPLVERGLAPSRLRVPRESSSSSATVHVKNGTLQGRYEPGFDQDIFLNIPYAAAPVGDLRLANPQPVNTSWSEPYDATAWGHNCPGTGYGGGYIQGTANDPRYNGSYLVQRSVENGEPIIFASINYRLGAYGFPGGQASADAGELNLGVKDQRQALLWVHENIAAFGGAPDKVTIWGQSAGGLSVTLQMLAYGGRDDGLFRGAVIVSGIFSFQNFTVETEKARWTSFLEATGCNNDNELACLRAIPYETFNEIATNTSVGGTPMQDGDYSRKDTFAAIAAGEVLNVPILIGAMKDEATCWFYNVLPYNSNDTIDALLAAYPNDNEVGCPFDTSDGTVSTGLQDKRSNAIWTDVIHSGTRFMSRKHGWLAPVWGWRFHQVPQNTTIDAGVGHSSEFPYLFRVLDRTVRTPLGNRPGDLDLSLRMQDYWLNFVNHLSPNKGGGSTAHEIYWPTYDKDSQNLIFQNNKTRVDKDDYRSEGIELQIKIALGQVKNGTLQGRYEPGFNQDIFLNIPYAAAPVGDLRLANPQPVNSSWSEPRDATAWGHNCPGIGVSSLPNITLGQDYSPGEDCLNINIVRPAGAQAGDAYPVLFWMHGGGFISGTANDPRYNGSYLVQRSVENGEPIIFASINYRLGALGFPAGQASVDAGEANLGVKDQRQALRWVQENIAAFGGSPDKVTIWGQSAGGLSVALQMLAYGGRSDGLFRGAIIVSGVFSFQNFTVETEKARWTDFLDAAGCNNSDELACLRALPYETFYSLATNTSVGGTPMQDGDFSRKDTLGAIAAGEVANVPILIGAMKDEATAGQGFGAPRGLMNETALRAALAGTGGFANVLPYNSNGSLDALLAAYPNDNEVGCPFDTGDGTVSTGLQDKRSNAIWTDAIHAGSRFMSRKHGWLAPVWGWRFHQVPQNTTIDAGVGHASEYPYTFGVLERTPRTPLGNRPGDLDLSRRLQDYWLNFVNHLNPNKGGGSTAREIYWPTYDKDSQNLIFQNNKTRVEKDDYRAEGIELQIKLGLGQA